MLWHGGVWWHPKNLLPKSFTSSAAVRTPKLNTCSSSIDAKTKSTRLSMTQAAEEMIGLPLQSHDTAVGHSPLRMKPHSRARSCIATINRRNQAPEAVSCSFKLTSIQRGNHARLRKSGDWNIIGVSLPFRCLLGYQVSGLVPRASDEDPVDIDQTLARRTAPDRLHPQHPHHCITWRYLAVQQRNRTYSIVSQGYRMCHNAVEFQKCRARARLGSILATCEGAAVLGCGGLR